MSSCSTPRLAWGSYILGAVGVLLIMAVVVKLAIQQTQPTAVLAGQKRADERRKNIAELRQSNAEVLNSYAWADQAKGIVRVPVDHALGMMLQEWQNPMQGRKKLLSRIEKATAVAPKAPEAPSVYE